ncbi:MAG: ATPase [Bacteroides sp. SM23_62_1]|nr:MAG: ATPase [Bacteroides sp. SM23_62_1]
MKEIRRVFHIKAKPDEIYNALTNPLSIELWTGYSAVMETKAGTEFSIWEGDIHGKNVEFIVNKKIIQEWYFGNQKNPSIVTIELFGMKGGTKIELIHINVPDEAFNNIDYGWKEYYFGALKRYLEK